jgi:hypothetical protein
VRGYSLKIRNRKVSFFSLQGDVEAVRESTLLAFVQYLANRRNAELAAIRERSPKDGQDNPIISDEDRAAWNRYHDAYEPLMVALEKPLEYGSRGFEGLSTTTVDCVIPAASREELAGILMAANGESLFIDDCDANSGP